MCSSLQKGTISAFPYRGNAFHSICVSVILLPIHFCRFRGEVASSTCMEVGNPAQMPQERNRPLSFLADYTSGQAQEFLAGKYVNLHPSSPTYSLKPEKGSHHPTPSQPILVTRRGGPKRCVFEDRHAAGSRQSTIHTNALHTLYTHTYVPGYIACLCPPPK